MAAFLNESASTNNSTYIKQIYVKNKQWNSTNINCNRRKNHGFWKNSKIQTKSNQLQKQKKTLSNLTYTQLAALRALKNDKNLILKPTEKNLGLAIIYTLQVLKEHLLTNDYRQLTSDTAKNKMEDIKTHL